MSKSRDAFRTISEVAEWLDTPAHVLRFWESKFSQVKPVKRAGGRRYYRPQDMALLGGIKKLLHEDGMTIKGVQKLLREKGVKHVAGFAPELPWNEEAAPKAATKTKQPAETPPEAADPVLEDSPKTTPEVEAEPEPEIAITNVVPLGREPQPGPSLSVNLRSVDEAEDATPDPEPDAEPDAEPAAEPETDTVPLSEIAAAVPSDPVDSSSKAPARFFHHWRGLADPDAALTAHAAQLAPLVSRLQALRGRIRVR